MILSKPSGKEEEPQYPSLLHKRLHERNGEIRADLHFFFQVGNCGYWNVEISVNILGIFPKNFVQELFRKNEDQLEDVCQSTQSSVELLQETVQSLQRSNHQVGLNFNSNSK